ncbi:MAG: hypothetical protein J3K34DRAFT_523776 [Monoraphidium minutum]|nr:MAG: hypothetical protein J3K34DRAFT_523776 [Monoraphidium minutum]
MRCSADAFCAECGHDHSHTHHKHAHGGGTAAAAAHQQQHRQQQPPGGGDAAAAAAFEEQERACWSCHDRHKRGSLLCQACDRIQPVDSSLTHFDIMGIKEPTYDVDEASLERRYKLLQWSLHPDKAVGRTPQERGFSAEHAAHINMAYGVLRRPLSRANYLLMLAGVPAGDHFEGTLEDPELLMEVMEAREEVEATDDPHALESLLRSCQASQRRLEGELSGAFKARENGRAAALVAQLTYYVRLEEAIVAKIATTCTDLLELSDATILLEDGGAATLPVHSQVLAAASPVLLFACTAAAQGGGACGKERAETRAAGRVVLSTPFSGFPLDAVALFLRLVYRMDEAAAPPTGVLDGVPLERLLGVLRLAHQLNAARLKGHLAAALGRRKVDSLPLLVAAANTAAECELGAVHVGVLRQLQAALSKAAADTAPAAVRAALAGLGPASHVELHQLSLGVHPGRGEVKQIRLPVTASYSFVVRGEGEGVRRFELSYSGKVLDARGQGTKRFAPLARLRDAQRGYLAGGALRVEVGITEPLGSP